MQNNYQGGIVSFEFIREGESLYLISTEGKTEYKYKIGFYGYEFTDLDFCGEKYTVGALAVAEKTAKDEEPKFKLEFIFPELPNTRKAMLTISERRVLTLDMTETPDERIADSFIDSLPAMNPKVSFLLDMLETNLGKNFIERRIAELFSPTLKAVATDADDFETLLADENYKVREKLSSMSMVRMLISKVTGIKSEEDEDEKMPSLGGMFMFSLFGKLFNKNKNPEQ